MPSDITVAIPSCNRPRLLRATLDGLIPHVRRHSLRVMVGENVAVSDAIRAAVDDVAARCPAGSVELVDLSDSITEASPKRRMLEAVDRLYDRIDSPFVFHLEDDWWLSEEDFLSPSRAILESHPEVTIVRLTGTEVRPFPDRSRMFVARVGDVEFPFCYSSYGGGGGKFGAFTFNPGLRRTSDRTRYFGSYSRFSGERAISELAQTLGHREAILDRVYAKHLGVGVTTLRLSRPRTAHGGPLKVFGVGMFKTGTTSFGEAMQCLGYRSCHSFTPLLRELSGYFDLDPGQFDPFEDTIRAKAERYDAFADAPWLYIYRRLSKWYPDSLFVLTLRSDAETIADSELSHWERHGLMDRWLKEVGTAPTRRMFIERYERHNANVVSYFRNKSHRLLQSCWEEEANPWIRLCGFIGVDAPDRPFPHANRAPRRD